MRAKKGSDNFSCSLEVIMWDPCKEEVVNNVSFNVMMQGVKNRSIGTINCGEGTLIVAPGLVVVVFGVRVGVVQEGDQRQPSTAN